jgi:hypothetical protein
MMVDRELQIGPLLLAGLIVGAAPPVHAQDTAPRQWTGEPVVQAGELDGPGALGPVFHVERGRGGELFVSQHTLQIISVFDGNGRFVRTLGRPGDGPGEFRGLGRIGRMADTLWAIDHGRLHLWDSELRLVRTHAPIMPVPSPSLMVIPGPPMAEGLLLALPRSSRPEDGQPVMLVDREGEVQRVLAYISTVGRVVELQFRGDPFGAPFPVTNPWADEPLWLNSADGRSLLVVERRAAARSTDAAFRIMRIDLAGDTVLNRTIPYEPVPLDRGARDEAIKASAERVARIRSVALAEAERVLQRGLPVPPHLPPVTQLVPGSDGTIWLRREDVRSETVTWDVFNEHGVLLGRIRLPTEFRVHGANRQHIWGVVRDDLDVPFVRVYRTK